MTAMDVTVIVIAIVATGVVVGWFLATRHVPEQAASHHDDDVVIGRTTSDDLYRGAGRPAGPDAEATDLDVLGGDQSPPNSGGAR
jgi:hypothetical protein